MVLLLAACGSEKSGTIETDDGTASYTIDESDGEVTATVDTGEGTATMRAGADVAVDLPQGLSIYPGATVVSNAVFEQADSRGALVTMEADASPAEMIDFYREQAEDAGMEIGLTMNTETMRMIGGKAEDGSSFSFTATQEGGKTTGQLMAGEAVR